MSENPPENNININKLRSKMVYLAILFFCAAVCFSGCENKEQTVTLNDVDLTEFQAIIKKHQGEVILVDFWAIWCDPCRAAFPHTVHLARKFDKQGLKVVSVSLDTIKDAPMALRFLNQHAARFDNLRSKYDISDSFTKYEIPEGIPYFRLYDRRGKLRYQFTGAEPATQEEMQQRIEELLKESAN